MQTRKIERLTKTELFGTFIGLGLLLFNGTIRGVINQSTFMLINIPVYIAFLFFLPKSVSVTKISKNFVRKLVFIWLPLTLIMLISMLESGGIRGAFIISIAIPVIIGLIDLNNSEDIINIFSVWLKYLNFVLFVVAFGGIIDLISNYSVTNFFVNLYHTEAILQMRIDEPNRIICILGHPLVASEIGLIGCICNYIDIVSLKTSKNQVLGFSISILVIALCGSKMAFVLALSLAFILNIENKNIKNILFLISIIFIMYSVGAFNVVLERFVNGINSGDLSTGRNIRLIELYSSERLQFDLFTGNGQALEEHFIIALEYPVLRWAYRYGIFYSICLSTVIFIYPLCIVLRRKQYFILGALLCLIIDVNTYSALAATGDGMLLFNVMLFILMNISHYYHKKYGIEKI